jgi:hypothetical protein
MALSDACSPGAIVGISKERALCHTCKHNLRFFSFPGLHEEVLFSAIAKLTRDLRRRCRAAAASASRGHSRTLRVEAQELHDSGIELHGGSRVTSNCTEYGEWSIGVNLPCREQAPASWCSNDVRWGTRVHLPAGTRRPTLVQTTPVTDIIIVSLVLRGLYNGR